MASCQCLLETRRLGYWPPEVRNSDAKQCGTAQWVRVTSKKVKLYFQFFGVFLVVKFINHVEFFTDFISFNQAPCSRSKNQYKLGACQKMQNYIFFFKSEYLSIHIYYWTFLYIFSREKTLDLNQRCVWKMVNSTVHHI